MFTTVLGRVTDELDPLNTADVAVEPGSGPTWLPVETLAYVALSIPAFSTTVLRATVLLDGSPRRQ